MSCRSIWLFPLAMIILTSPISAETEVADDIKQRCVTYQNELVALETPALRDRLKQDPQKAVAELPEAEIAKIRRLIELDEFLMFRCRIGLKPLGVAQNPNGRSALQQAVGLPALPVRRPKVARRPVTPRVIVPLPTRRSDAK